MYPAGINYLPLALPFFSILVGAFGFLILFLYIGALGYAYEQVGLSPRAALLALGGSLIGSYFNLPVAETPAREIVSGEIVPFFGMRYVVPVVVNWPGTVIAVNVGGALIPGAISIYLLVRKQLWVRGPLAILCVAIVTHLLARPVPGLGIALPVFVPAVASAVVALILSRRQAGPLAYLGGSMGTLIGADLLNLNRVQGLGAPVASIGGAGTFDGIFLTGILAVLIASFSSGGAGAGSQPEAGTGPI
ncbi:MAG: DUF1614 domain-containing protein [Rhodospirillales bacterium]|nr:DUF1614 domain-containing protein [Rhodospirillales bacterium]